MHEKSVNYNVFDFELRSISSIILSPRIQAALYKGVDFKEVDFKQGDYHNTDVEKFSEIRIIYPFYTHQDRSFNKDSNFAFANDYYIPGSSIKGALLSHTSTIDESDKTMRSNITVKDIHFYNNTSGLNFKDGLIKLSHLYKFQYLYQEVSITKENDGNQLHNRDKLPTYEEFFPQMAVEMLKPDKVVTGKIVIRSLEEGSHNECNCKKSNETFFKEILSTISNFTKLKLNNYKQEIKERIKFVSCLNIEESEKEDLKKCLNGIDTKLSDVISKIENGKNIIFVGGYKGILGSLNHFLKNQEVNQNHKNNALNSRASLQNGFYIDKETCLPYGLAMISLKNK